jgi:cytochrome c oxidase subunit 3
MDLLLADNPTERPSGAKITLFLVLASETAFFATLVMAYLYLRTTQSNWPIQQLSLSRMALPGLNTLLLLISALLAGQGLTAIQQDRRAGLKRALAITFLLGLVFILGQVLEYNHAGMAPSDPAFGGVFLALMGFHALHVLAGMVVLAYLLWRAQAGDFQTQDYVPVEVGVWFWYYVVAVWAVLFTVLYLV